MTGTDSRTDKDTADGAPGGPANGFEASPPSWLRPLRDRVRRMPGGAFAWKVVVGLVGALLAGVGLLLIPLPGPGWAIVFLGVAVWATEFSWAQRLLAHGRRMLREWTGWAGRQSLLVRGLLVVTGLALLAAVFYGLFRFL